MISGPVDPKSSQAQPSWVVGAPVLAASRLGQVLDGEFLIKGVLGQGELGVTYEAENSRLKRKFAVLMLSRELKPTHEMMLAVRNDLRRAQQLGAGGLMPVKMLADREGIPGFATELLDGETLRARLSRGPLRVERGLAVVASVARTMEAAHKVGLVHGDLRPENIFLVRPSAKSTSAGKVMVVEHGLHHLRRRAPGLDDRLPLYKHLYRPPEQVAGVMAAGERGDVFVLGAILYECLTARPAFFAEEIEFVLENLASPPPPLKPNPATGLSGPLAEALTLLIRQACALQWDERVPNMTELLEGIDQVVQGYGLKLPEVPVETKDEAAAAIAAAPAPATTQADRSMGRLLQRLSGVFPQIAVPMTTSPVQPTGEGAAAPVDAKAGPAAMSNPQLKLSSEAAASLPRLEPLQQERVSRILQRLSGAFPVIAQAPPEESAGAGESPQASPSGPAAAGAGGVAEIAVSPDSVPTDPRAKAPALEGITGAAATPAAVSPAAALVPPALAGAAVQPPTDPPASLAVAVGVGVVVEVAKGSAGAPAPSAAVPAVAVAEDRASGAVAPAVAEVRAASVGPAPSERAASAGIVSAGSSVTPVPVPDAAAGAPPVVAAAGARGAAGGSLGNLPTVEAIAVGARVDAPPPSASTPSSTAAVAAVAPVAIDGTATALAAAAAIGAQPITAPLIPTPPVPAAVQATPGGAEDPPLLQSAVAIPIPSPPLPPTLVGAMADLSGIGPAGSPGAANAADRTGQPAEPTTAPRLEVSTELAVPHLPAAALGALLPAPVVLLPPNPASPSPALLNAQTAVRIAPTRVSEMTLGGDDLAELIEPSVPSLPVPPVPPGPAGPAPSNVPLGTPPPPTPAGAVAGGVRQGSDTGAPAAADAPDGSAGEGERRDSRTLSEVATRPVLAALAARLAPMPSPLSEQATQPALRRMPITELATQAKLPVASEAAASSQVPAIGGASIGGSAAASAGGGEGVGDAAATPAPAPPVGMAVAPTMVQVASSPAGVAAAMAPGGVGGGLVGDASPAGLPVAPARPPGPPSLERLKPPPRPPRISQLIAALQVQQGPARAVPDPDPKGTGGHARGLMAPAPEGLPTPPVSDAGSVSGLIPGPKASAPLVAVSPVTPTAPAPSAVGGTSTGSNPIIDWALRHQELVAAGMGALLVVLLTLLYLIVLR